MLLISSASILVFIIVSAVSAFETKMGKIIQATFKKTINYCSKIVTRKSVGFFFLSVWCWVYLSDKMLSEIEGDSSKCFKWHQDGS